MKVDPIRAQAMRSVALGLPEGDLFRSAIIDLLDDRAAVQEFLFKLGEDAGDVWGALSEGSSEDS